MCQTETKLIQIQSIGNGINIAVYLYRYYIKKYFKLAVIAHLWLLVPIYGWAKFYANSALISRLAFCELSNKKESLKEAKSKTYSQMCNFLIAGILVLIIPVILALIFAIGITLIWGILSALLTKVFGLPPIVNSAEPFDGSPQTIILATIIISIYLSPLWFYSRLFIGELSLAVGNKSNAFKTIQKSWKLTKKFRFYILTIILLSYSITLPIQILLFPVLGLIIIKIPIVDSLPSEVSGWLVLIAVYVVSGIFTMPFCQALKATVYYDLSCRKEGFDLQLHKRI